jgi:hypothetical protein
MAAQVRVVMAQDGAAHLTDAELEQALHDGRAWDVFLLEDLVLLMAEGQPAPVNHEEDGE